MIKKILKLDWNEYQNMIDKLVNKIKNDGLKYDGIYGVPRGGLIIAVSLSHKLKLPILMYPTNNTLVVDDISDNGITLQNLKYKSIATLFSSNWTVTIPTYFIDTKLSKDEWIIFPWEDENEIKQTKITEFIK